MERGLHADLPVTDAAAARTLALPMFPGLTDDEQDRSSPRSGRPSSATSPRRRAPSSPLDEAGAARDARQRIGLAGLGAMGRNHLRILTARPGRPPRRGRGSGSTSWPSRRGADRRPAVRRARRDGRRGGLDALVIAAPTTAHVPLALAAIERGVAVLVEKPLAATVDEGMRIVAAARRRGVPVQVGHVERFNPAVLELGRLLADGWLSTVYAIASPARCRSRRGSATSA